MISLNPSENGAFRDLFRSLKIVAGRPKNSISGI